MQQENIREAMKGLAHLVSGHALANNLTWPFVSVPMFEMYGADALIQGNCEFFAFWPRVPHDEREAYETWATANYQEIYRESHMIKHGNLDRLDDGSSYHSFIAQIGEAGYEPDIERDEYWANINFSPPTSNYGITNWNVYSLPPFKATLDAMLQMRYETVLSAVMPYKSDAFTEEEHAAMHSKLKDSSLQNPHTFAQHPVHRDPLDYNSDIVAMISSGFAFDAALLGLLPEGVEGIVCVLKNNANQSYTYEIDGHDAVFQGEGDLHETKYDHMKRVVELALHTNPIFTSTPGHIQYHMEIYPSSKFEQSYDSNTPELFAGVVAATFVLVALVFFVSLSIHYATVGTVASY